MYIYIYGYVYIIHINIYCIPGGNFLQFVNWKITILRGFEKHVAIVDFYIMSSVAILKYQMPKCIVVPKSTVPFLFVGSPPADYTISNQSKLLVTIGGNPIIWSSSYMFIGVVVSLC